MQERVPIWLVQDRWGRDIMLYEDIWHDHILFGHAYLHGHESTVARVLEYPHRVMYDAIEERRECFYRAEPDPEFRGQLIKVCVEFEPIGDGIVITAYLTPHVRDDEVQRWP